jgi:UTP:GlnB (protein PII) uridylyltransferase
VVADDDGKRKKFLGKIIQRIEAAMVRRGISPHNRLTPIFNAYVVSLGELRGLLDRRGPETFIDQAEVLEARFMLGDPAIEVRFENEVRGLVRERAGDFVRDALREVRDNRTHPNADLDLKVGAGGLREIQLLGLAVAVQLRRPGRVAPEHYRGFAEGSVSATECFETLAASNETLRRIRDLHRLLVSLDDPLQPEVMLRLASDLPSLASFGSPSRLPEETRAHMARAAGAVDAIAALVLENRAHGAQADESPGEG